jgi:NADH:ubiquinone oxidoreductase subunit F (NADH-binding)
MVDSAAFRDVLLQSVDDALLVPGEIVRAAIYDRVERSYQLKREEIPEKLELFHKALRDLLAAGGEVLERLIAKNLYRRLDLNFNQHESWTVLDYVDEAKKAHK